MTHYVQRCTRTYYINTCRHSHIHMLCVCGVRKCVYVCSVYTYYTCSTLHTHTTHTHYTHTHYTHTHVRTHTETTSGYSQDGHVINCFTCGWTYFIPCCLGVVHLEALELLSSECANKVGVHFLDNMLPWCITVVR